MVLRFCNFIAFTIAFMQWGVGLSAKASMNNPPFLFMFFYIISLAQAVQVFLQRHMMKLIIPLFENRISPYFDYAPAILLVTVDGGNIVERQEVNFSGWSMEQRLAYCRDAGVSILICGGITNNAHCLLENSGIRVIPWVSGEAEKALALYLKGRLEAGTMLCKGKRRRWHFCTAREKKEA